MGVAVGVAVGGQVAVRVQVLGAQTEVKVIVGVLVETNKGEEGLLPQAIGKNAKKDKKNRKNPNR